MKQQLNPLVKLRAQKCITVRTLRDDAQLSTRTIWQIENGLNKRINAKTLRKIVDYFEIDGGEFLEEYMQWREQYYIHTTKEI